MRKRERLLVPELIWVNRPKAEGQSPFVEYLDGWRLGLRIRKLVLQECIRVVQATLQILVIMPQERRKTLR